MDESTMTRTGQTVDWSRIAATGSQAEAFLQGQLSQDMGAVTEQGMWTLVLAPDSVVIAACFATRIPDGVALSVERDLAEAVRGRLARFLLRTDCRLEISDSATGPYDDVAERVRRGWPGAPEFAAGLTPHSFGDSFVKSTISFTKGCFTGQELVGRLDARGSSVPWRLVRASGPERSTVDEVLRSKGPEGPQGLTTVLETLGRITGLGFVHRTLLADSRVVVARDVTVEAIG